MHHVDCFTVSDLNLLNLLLLTIHDLHCLHRLSFVYSWRSCCSAELTYYHTVSV